MKLSMGCKGCAGMKNMRECSCINMREREIEELNVEVLKLKSLKEKVRVLEDIVSVLEEMTNTDINIEIEDRE